MLPEPVRLAQVALEYLAGADLGSGSVRSSICLGILNPAMWSRQCRISSSWVTCCLVTTIAKTDSPQRGSGTPKTATSATGGWAASASSTSME